MKYLGDFLEDSTVYFGWSTNDANGASITRATDGTVQVYKDDGTTESVAGITDTEDFDGLTGIHMCKIDTGADAFYATGHDYTVVLAGATIDGQTVNAVLANFSIENRCREGYKLASDGLDSISTTEPSGLASNFREMMVQLFGRFFYKVTANSSEITTHKSNGDANTDQVISTVGETKTVNKAEAAS